MVKEESYISFSLSVFSLPNTPLNPGELNYSYYCTNIKNIDYYFFQCLWHARNTLGATLPCDKHCSYFRFTDEATGLKRVNTYFAVYLILNTGSGIFPTCLLLSCYINPQTATATATWQHTILLLWKGLSCPPRRMARDEAELAIRPTPVSMPRCTNQPLRRAAKRSSGNDWVLGGEEI